MQKKHNSFQKTLPKLLRILDLIPKKIQATNISSKKKVYAKKFMPLHISFNILFIVPINFTRCCCVPLYLIYLIASPSVLYAKLFHSFLSKLTKAKHDSNNKEQYVQKWNGRNEAKGRRNSLIEASNAKI